MAAITEGFAGFPYMLAFSAPYHTALGIKEGGFSGGVKGALQGGIAIPAWAVTGFLTSIGESAVNVLTFGNRLYSGEIPDRFANLWGKPFSDFVQPEVGFDSIGQRLNGDGEVYYEKLPYLLASLAMFGPGKQHLGIRDAKARRIEGVGNLTFEKKGCKLLPTSCTRPSYAGSALNTTNQWFSQDHFRG